MSNDYKDDIARLQMRIHEMETALEKMKINLAALTGIAESCEYYMDLADRRGKVIDSLRSGADTEVDTPCQITTRCTYLMTQEDLND